MQKEYKTGVVSWLKINMFYKFLNITDGKGSVLKICIFALSLLAVF